MYEMKNGLLHIDGEPVIGLGAAVICRRLEHL